MQIFLLLLLFVGNVTASSFEWYWPNVTTQCEDIEVLFFGGSPPWTVTVAPIYGQPFIWTITPLSDYDPNNATTGYIPLKLKAGVEYVAYVADTEGYNAYDLNPTEIQVVGYTSNSTCLASTEDVPLEFEFAVAGNTSACSDGFGISWTDAVGAAPYSMTIIPLDTAYNPWDVDLPGTVGGEGSYQWQVNMTEGSRFTVMMNNNDGHGCGGIGGVYEVSAGSDGCVEQTNEGTLPWPSPVSTNAVPTTVLAASTMIPTSIASTTPTTMFSLSSSSTSSSSSSSSASSTSKVSVESGSKLAITAGAAGGAGGAVVIALGLALCFLLRRRRKLHNRNKRSEFDLGHGYVDDDPSTVEGKDFIEPYPGATDGLRYHPTSPEETVYVDQDMPPISPPMSTTPSQRDTFMTDRSSTQHGHQRESGSSVQQSSSMSGTNQASDSASSKRRTGLQLHEEEPEYVQHVDASHDLPRTRVELPPVYAEAAKDGPEA